MKNNRILYIYLPIAFAFVLIAGILTGYYLLRSSFVQNYALLKGVHGKSTLTELIRYIDKNYVDSVDTKKLNDEAIIGMLLSLDPHSVYIPASEFADANDPLMGNFEGIGIQFKIRKSRTACRRPYCES